MFRMLGNKVELYTHKVTYNEGDNIRQENCVSEAHKDEIEQMLFTEDIEFSTEEIDQTGNSWINGLEFNSYDEALKVFAAGESAYLFEKAKTELSDNLRLRADIDYIAIMTEVSI